MIKKITLLVCIILAMVNLAFSQKGKVTINAKLPAWLQAVKVINSKPAYKNIQDGYYLFLFEKQNNLETKEQYSHIIREISNGTGVQNGSEISVSYDPSYEKLVFHKLTIWRDNKPMDKLSLQNFKILQNEKELSRFIYSGLYTAYLILDDIRKGDRIEYAYTIQGSNPVFPKYSNTIYFEGSSQIVNVYNNIIFKPGRNIRTKNFNSVPPLKRSVVKGLNVFEWQNSMSKTYPSNDFEPSDFDPFARVQISEYKNWQEIVDWGLSLQQFNSKNSPIINEKVAELKLKAKGNKEKFLELATRFVQDEIRYMGIEIGEYSHRPNSPEKILKQRYGDCKDKSTLLCNLLKANGINAYSVFLNTYLKKETASLLPSPSVFNHETVVVEFEDRKIYIDPTVANQRGPIFNNYFPYTAKVLVIKDGNKELTETAQQNLGKLKSLVVFNVGDTSGTSKSTLRITSDYSNNYADNFRENLNNEGADNIEKSYVKYYSNLYPGLTIKDPIEIKDNEAENIISVTETYEIDSLWTHSETDQSKRLAYFYGDLINDQIISIKKFRNAPLSLKFPCTIEQEVRIILPEIWNFENENINIDNENYRFLYSANAKFNTLTLTYYYQNFTPVLQTNSINDYIKDSKEILNTISYGIYWGGTGPVENDGLNLKLLGIGFVALLLSIFIAIYLYTRKTEFNLDSIKNAWRLGGWLSIPGIGITLNPLIILVAALKQEIYTDKIWQGIQQNAHSLLLNLSVIFTVVFNVMLFVFSIFILVSFYKRRDFFPKYYIAFLIFSFLITLLDTIASIYINKLVNNEILGASEFYSVLRIGIFAAIWITYFIKSERVKQTFVFSYPDSDWRKAVIQDLNENFRINNLEQEENIIKKQETIDIEENERL
jgi:transglutaminase-like putative cysteine protease